MRKVGFLCALFVLLGGVGCGGSKKEHTLKNPFGDAETPWRNFRFHPKRFGIMTDNGIRVVVLPDFSTERIEVGVRYDVGAISDPAGKGGLAHLVEHLLFEIRSGDETSDTLGQRLQEIAIDSNATTTLDSTHFSTMADKKYLGDILGLEARRMQGHCEELTEEVVAREREVVRNELAQRGHNLTNQVYQKLIAELYPAGHLYLRSPGGTDDEVSQLSKEDVCGFIEEHYNTENALVLVSGPITYREVSDAVEALEIVKPSQGKKKTSPLSPVEGRSRKIEFEADISEPLLMAAWPVAPHYSSEGFLSQLIVQRIAGEVRIANSEQKFAEAISLELVGGARAPFAVLSLELSSSDQESAAIQAIDDAMKRVGTSWTGGTVASGFFLMTLKLLKAYEGLATRSGLFADYIQFGNMSLLSGDFEAVRDMEGKELAAISARVFQKRDRALILVSPGTNSFSSEKPPRTFESASSTIKRRQSDANPSQAMKDAPLGPLSAKVQSAHSFTLDNGLRVFIQPDGKTPLLDLVLMFNTGSTAPKGSNGVATAAAHLLRENDKKSRSNTLLDSSLLDSSLLQTEAQVDGDTTTFRVSGYSFVVDFAIDGLAKRITEGQYKGEHLKKYSSSLGKKISRQSSVIRRRQGKAIMQALWGKGHPNATSQWPADGELAPLQITDLQRFRAANYRPEMASLIVRGKFDRVKVENYVRMAFSDWGTLSAPSPLTAKTTKPFTKRALLAVEREEAEQIGIRLMYPLGVLSEPRYAVWLLIAEMIDGRMRAVREELAATYGLHSTIVRKRAGAYLQISGTVDTRASLPAVSAILRYAEEHDAGEDYMAEFASARKRLVRRLSAPLAGAYSLQNGLEVAVKYGFPTDHGRSLVAIVAKLRPTHTIKAAKFSLRPIRRVAVLVGKKELLSELEAVMGETLQWIE